MLISLSGISNQKLNDRLKKMVRNELGLSHQIVFHLAEAAQRRLVAEMGYASMFDYVTRGLGYSRSSAQRRIVAARIVGKFPESYECLEDGRLTLGVLEAAADALDRPNARELLKELYGKSREEALNIVAFYLPIEAHKLADRIERVVVAKRGVSEIEGQASLFDSEQNSNYSRSGVLTDALGNLGAHIRSIEEKRIESER